MFLSRSFLPQHKKTARHGGVNIIQLMKTILLCAVLISMSGCAFNSPLASLFNPNTHQINFKDTTGDFRAERTMMAEALKYCDILDKHFVPVELTKSFITNTYTLTFRCLDPDSPELQKKLNQNNPDNGKQDSSDSLPYLQSGDSLS